MPYPRNDRAREAVSPVVATVLMLAIAVLLAGGTFLLAERLRGAPPDAPAHLQLLTEPGAGWRMRVAAATSAQPLDAYRFALALPNGTRVLVAPVSNAGFAAGADAWYASLAGTAAGAVVTATGTEPAATTAKLRVLFRDVSGEGRLNPFDEVTVALDDGDADAAYDDALAPGAWGFDVLSRRSEALAGTATRTVD